MVAPRIRRISLHREAIGSRERLCTTLRYLAFGNSRGRIAATYKISQVTVSCIISKTCLGIGTSLLQKGFVALPETPDDWKKIADNCYCIWNFPNCIGCIDGENLLCRSLWDLAPWYMTSDICFNYSIAFMTVYDSRYRIILSNMGQNGRSSDGGIFAYSHFGVAFEEKTLKLPKPFFYQKQKLIFPPLLLVTRCFLLNIIWCNHIQKKC